MRTNIICLIILVIILCFNIISYSELQNWVAKINGDIITLNDLNSMYYAQQKSIYNDATNEDIDKRAANSEELAINSTLDKKEFLENVIRQRLVFKKAVDDGELNNKELKTLVELAREAVVVGYYVKNKYKDQIDVTDNEIDNIYTEQKERFKNAPSGSAKQYIKQQLMQQKLQLKLKELVEVLKEKSIINKNFNLITK